MYKIIEICQKKQSNSNYYYLMSSINSGVLEQDIKLDMTSPIGNIYVVQNRDRSWSVAEKINGAGADYLKIKTKNGLTLDVIQLIQRLNY